MEGIRMKAVIVALAVLVTVLAPACKKVDETAVREKRGQEQGIFPQGEVVDLTHSFSSETVYWPTSEPFVLENVFKGVTGAGFFYFANNFSAAEHGGTHIDAPAHFAMGGKTVDEIPLERLMGEAVVIDVSGSALGNRDYQVAVADFTRWEKENGRLPRGSIVLLKTGYGRYWPDREKYMGTAERGEGAVEKLHFPGLAPEAAVWITGNREISAVGIDTPSIDYGQSKLFWSHRILFERGIPAFENLANLDRLPPKGAFVIALPMKIKGGSGGPLRIVAIVPRGQGRAK